MPGIGQGVGVGLNYIPGNVSTDIFQQIFADYNFYNMWTSLNVVIDGTTTVFNDYAGEHNLTNSSAAKQPSYNISGNVGTIGLPTFTFDGVSNEMEKITSDWRILDATGEIISIFRVLSGNFINILTSYNPGARNDFAQVVGAGTAMQMVCDDLSNPPRTTANGTIDIITSAPTNVHTIGCRPGDYYMYNNGVSDAFSAFINGSDNGACWLAELSGRTDISIGRFANIEWLMSGYRPYSSLTDSVNLHNELLTIIGT